MKKKVAFFIGIIFFCLFSLTELRAEISKEDFKLFKDDLTEISLKEQKYSLLIGTGMTVGAFFADDEVKRRSAHWHSGTNDVISDFGNFVGNPIVDFSASSLLYVVAKKDTVLERASFTALEAVFLSTVTTETIAYSLGRKRPDQNESSTTFKPFSGSSSFPSAHAASSMAFFSTYARYYGEPYSWWFYTAFAATVFGRIYENRHYLSDVVMGSTIGYVTSSYLYERHKKNGKTSFMPIMFATDKTVFIGFSKYF